MYQALLWKEYRETRLPTIAVLLLVIFLPYFLKLTPEDNLAELGYLIFTTSWFFYALFLGADTFAKERQQETMIFFQGQALSYTTIWISIIATRLLLLFFMGMIYLICLDSLLVQPFDSSFTIIISAIFCFALSFLFSTIVSNSVTAGGAGFAGGLFVVITVPSSFIFIICFIMTILALVASYILFTRYNEFSL